MTRFSLIVAALALLAEVAPAETRRPGTPAAGPHAAPSFVANVKNVITGKVPGLNEIWMNPATEPAKAASQRKGGSAPSTRSTWRATSGGPHRGDLAQPLAAATSTTEFDCDYLGEDPPGTEPKLFAPGRVSIDGKNSHAISISPDGRSLVFSRYPDKTSFIMARGPSGWSAPQETPFRGKEVAFDADGRRLFYYDEGDLFFVRILDGRFSEPTRLPSSINTSQIEYYPSVTAKGNLYFSQVGQWDSARIQMARLEGEGFAAPVDLGAPINVGGASHAFVSPDETYMVFNSPREGSHTKNDVWVSLRSADGAWGTPANLGPRVNGDAEAVLCPTISPDGKYLFFTRLQANRTGHVYWVSTRVIEEARARVEASGSKGVTR